MLENLPFKTVESKNFRRSQRILKLDIYIPTAFIVKKYISDNYIFYKTKLKEIFENLDSKISFTVDAWSDSCMNHFMGITSHFIYNKKLQCVGIGFEKCDNSSGEGLAKIFIKILSEYNIEKKIFAISSDNGKKIFILAPNNGVFINYLSSHLKAKGINFDISVNWVRCICHVINLCVEGIVFFDL